MLNNDLIWYIWDLLILHNGPFGVSLELGILMTFEAFNEIQCLGLLVPALVLTSFMQEKDVWASQDRVRIQAMPSANQVPSL